VPKPPARTPGRPRPGAIARGRAALAEGSPYGRSGDACGALEIHLKWEAAMWTYVIQGIGYGFAAAVQPGPFQAYLFSQTLSRGWRQTMPAALAPLVSDGPIILLVLLVLVRVPLWLQRGLCLGGGFFLLYLARQAFSAWRNFDEGSACAGGAGRQSLVRAAMMNALSPGPYLYWSLVTGPILLAGWREAPALGLGFLASFYAAIVLSLGGIIVLFGTSSRLGPKVNRALLGISAAALLCFGLYQIGLGVLGGSTSVSG
jgi:threonine/homoserine/homoserine lactone efflux protein